MSNTDPIKNWDAWKSKAVPASYQTPTVLLIYTIKSGKCVGGDRGKKTST
jgi:hypothetical protein